MDDSRIVALYFARSERAIRESARKYGAYCGAVAYNVLENRQDAEECVNDTWLRAWNAIPPQKPDPLLPFFGKITRRLALDRWRAQHSEKRGGGQTALCLEELAEVVGEAQAETDALALRDLLQAFLSAQPEDVRSLFLYRYWYAMPIKEIARRTDRSEGAVKMSLSRTREKLRVFLAQEGVTL